MALNTRLTFDELLHAPRPPDHSLPPDISLSNAWETVLDPLRYLDLSSIYDAYSSLIDLAIYVLIFVGASQATLGQRFPGNAGRAVSIGAGMSLAFAMTVAEKTYGFAIKDFGPLAVTIIVVVLGIMIYKLFQRAGAGRLRSASAAYLALFAAALIIAPDLLGWLTDRLPLASLLLVLASLAAVTGLATALWPTHTPAFVSRIRQAQARKLTDPPTTNALRGESRFLKRRIRPLTKQALKDSKTILRDLKAVRKAAERYGADPQARTILAGQLRNVLPRQHQLQAEIERLRRYAAQILNLDTSIFTRKRRQRLQDLGPEQKAVLTQQLQDQLAKIRAEQKLDRIQQVLQRQNSDIDQFVRDAAQHLAADRVPNALPVLRDAETLEHQNYKLAQALKNLEQKIVAINKAAR